MNTIEAAKAAYLVSSGVITQLAGFTGTKPLPERRAPAPEAETASGPVDREYIAHALGVKVKSRFSTTAHRHLLPKSAGRSSRGCFVYNKDAADAAIVAIKQMWAERDSEARVGRWYFVERLGMTYATLFSMTSNWERHLPAPIDGSALGTGSKRWYDKKEADEVIRKIKKTLKERADANA